MRDAYRKLFNVSSIPNAKDNFYEVMEKSGWLGLIKKLLSAAKDIATVMDNHEKNVLIH